MRAILRAVAALALAALLALFACDNPDSAERPGAQRAAADQGGDYRQSRASQLARTQFRIESIVDRTHGGLVAVRYAVPADWRAASSLTWNYSDVSWPVRAAARAEAPDGSAWIEVFPSELFYWSQPLLMPVTVGSRSLGMVYAPNIGAVEAMARYVIVRYRGNAQNLQFVGWRPVPNLAQALGKPPKPGDSIAVRVRYQLGGEPVDEEFYGLLGAVNPIPYTGPQGTTYEIHRELVFVHSMGAKGGKLESLYPLLGFVAASFQVDPVWERMAQQVNRQLQVQFNQYIARGYAQINAARQLSRAITANNEAISAMVDEQYRVRSASQDRIHDNFKQYIRGTERVHDPVRGGTSEQPNAYRYHWTDALGTVQHSDNPNYNPNIGSTTTWQPMEPVR
jgi:hypothetical protein